MDYQESLNYLLSIPMFQKEGAKAYNPGIERSRELNEYCGNPQSSYKTIHIAGTNGKGSCSSMLAAILMQSGYKVGLYTSPHLADFRERIRVNGNMIDISFTAEFITKYKDKAAQLKASFFEITTALAFSYFKECGVDIAIIEVGMGGRLDSTNIITPLLSVITNISFDHKMFLGNTLPEIASEKAGIIKSYIPVVIGESSSQTDIVFISKAKEENAPIIFADKCYKCEKSEYSGKLRRFFIKSMLNEYIFTLKSDLTGIYQEKNIQTVITSIDYLNEYTDLNINRECVEVGLKNVTTLSQLRGRWSRLSEKPLIICDTGHNEAGINNITEQLKQERHGKLFCVIGFVADKDLSSIIKLLPKDAYYIFTQASIARALDAGELANIAAEAGLKGEVVPKVPDALSKAKELASENDTIFVGGSTFVVAEIPLL